MKQKYKTIFGVRPHPLVEHTAVNRGVVGSSPTRGAKRQWDDVQLKLVSISVYGFFCGQKLL